MWRGRTSERGGKVTDLDRRAGSRARPARGLIARVWRSAFAWPPAAAAGAYAVLRITSADRIPGLAFPLAGLVSLTPYAAAAAPVTVLAAAALRRRNATILAVLATAGLAAAVVPRAIPDRQPAAKGPVLRILSANLMFSTIDPAYLYDLIQRTRPDLVSLQEFTLDEADGLAKAGIARLLPYNLLQPEWGAAGSGLYSRFPLNPLLEPATTMRMPRATVDLPAGRQFEMYVVHPLPPITRDQTRDWRHDLDTLPPAHTDGPARVLAGDFNATLDMGEFRTILSHGYADAADRRGKGLIPTWGIDKFGPPLSFDHVVVDRRVAVRGYSVHLLPGSDHRAVLAVLQLP
jgi:endonuclease/exonuclease/phosphatase (EEP) superfamily protein YafD